MLRGKWDKDDIRRVFVAGASWWEFHSTGGTMWTSGRALAEEEATQRYPPDAESRCECDCHKTYKFILRTLYGDGWEKHTISDAKQCTVVRSPNKTIHADQDNSCPECGYPWP